MAGRAPGVQTEYLLPPPTTARIYKPSVSQLPAKGRAFFAHYRFTRGVRNNWGRFFRRVKEVARNLASGLWNDFEQIVPSGHSRPQLASRQERPHALRTVSPARRQTFALPLPTRRSPGRPSAAISVKSPSREVLRSHFRQIAVPVTCPVICSSKSGACG